MLCPAKAATIPADIAQYYGYMLRATQKLMYLYGFPQIDVEENCRDFDSETLNLLIRCMGVMYGGVGASNALKAVDNGGCHSCGVCRYARQWV